MEVFAKLLVLSMAAGILAPHVERGVRALHRLIARSVKRLRRVVF